MKISEAYSLAVSLLENGNIENASFEADCLIESLFFVDRIKRINHPENEVDFEKLDGAIKKRISGIPLQYIVGSWDFFGYSYKVGEGVLIPRPETELLVEKSIELIKAVKNPVIYDLCAGTGCIGLTLAGEIKNSTVYLFEKARRRLSIFLKTLRAFQMQFP